MTDAVKCDVHAGKCIPRMQAQYNYALHMWGGCQDALIPQVSCTLYKHTMLSALLEGTSLTVYLDAEVMESSPTRAKRNHHSTRLAWPDEYLLSNASHMI